jgi:hypothetical protein
LVELVDTGVVVVFDFCAALAGALGALAVELVVGEPAGAVCAHAEPAIASAAVRETIVFRTIPGVAFIRIAVLSIRSIGSALI